MTFHFEDDCNDSLQFFWSSFSKSNENMFLKGLSFDSRKAALSESTENNKK